MKYTVDAETLEVYIYVPSQEAALIYQPHNPDGNPWKDAEEATTWAESWIAEYEAALAANPVVEETPAE